MIISRPKTPQEEELQGLLNQETTSNQQPSLLPNQNMTCLLYTSDAADD